MTSLRQLAWLVARGGEGRELLRYTRERNDLIDLSIAGLTAEISPSSYSEWITIQHFNEQKQLEFLLDYIDGSTVYWDVGANIGLYSLLTGKVAREIVCFEPDPILRNVLANNLRNNGLHNVILQPIALGAEHGTIAMMENHRWRSTPFTAPMRRGDTLDLPAPDVVKIDVEGFEFEVVRGLDRVLDSVSLLLIEVHPHKFASAGWPEFKDWLEQRGFKIERLGHREQVFHVAVTPI